MSETPQDNYLVTEVMTAPPQKLQLMLVEAAIRSIERARQAWREDDDEQGGDAPKPGQAEHRASSLPESPCPTILEPFPVLQ